MMAATTPESVAAPTFGSAASRHVDLSPTRSAAAASWTSLQALILRDLVVLWKHKVEFTVRTLVQPFLLCFVFLYVFPKIGQGIGAASGIPGAESAFATVLVPGVVGLSIMFQGIQAVAMPLAQEFGFTREIEDRVQAPCPIWLVAISKVISGGAQGLISAAIVLPIASVVHAAGVEAQINLHWLLWRNGSASGRRGVNRALRTLLRRRRTPSWSPSVAQLLPGQADEHGLERRLGD